MEKVFILVNNKYFELALINLLEIVGYLPVILSEQELKIKNKEKILFTNYYYFLNKVHHLDYFYNIIVFIPYKFTFIDTQVSANKNIIYYNNTLTVNNIKNLCQKLTT